ncbi:T9SS type A sorting domain-containing protein [Aequorivita sinensis]|uniref:T9SS type A sorting domain-containing protein n=1 Tax=Aequorivita sinensis TaxID=1382458 RepID=UPI0023006D07|nr:T9SS type A sorting domain-containing protein [Aequorivita sinensis]
MKLIFKIYKTRISMLNILCIGLFLLPLGLYAQVTNIPDPNFKQALIDLGIDSDGMINGQVLTSDIENVILLNVNNKNINDFTGIEGFDALENLDVSFNFMPSLDLSGNSNLKNLVFDRSFNLSTIDITSNLNLETIKSNYSLLTELNLSNNINLLELDLGESAPSTTNGIENLDLSHNTMLHKLHLENLELLRVLDIRSGFNFILTDFFVLCVNDDGDACEPFPCLMVDDYAAAQNNQFPYSEWDGLFNFSEDCSLGTNDINEKLFSIYPNPVNEVLVLNGTKNISNLKTQIYSTEGKILNTQHIDFNKQTTINVSNLSSGIYFLNIEDESGRVEVKKFVKQ